MADKQQQTPAFGLVEFSRPRVASVYEGRRGGKSTMAILASVPTSSGLVVEAAIWARLTQTGEGYEVTFEAALPARVTCDDDTRTRFVNHVEAQASAWIGFNAATDLAEERLAQAIGEKPVTKTARTLASRLIKSTKLARVNPV